MTLDQKYQWGFDNAPLSVESLDLQGRLESAVGLQQHLKVLDDAINYIDEQVLDGHGQPNHVDLLDKHRIFNL